MSVLEAGQSFGRYTIINLEAAVGPIESYRAYDSSIGRDVRLSVLATRDRLVSDRFHAAMIALLDLQHPNILDIYDAGDIGGVLYLAMPLVDGITLAQRLSQGALVPAEINKIVEQVAGALQYAHEHGIADGAVTLENILINTRGDALLSGFGAGALAGSDDQAAVRRRDLAMLGRVVLALLAGHALMGGAGESISALLQPYIERLPKSVQSVVAPRYLKLVDRATTGDAAQRFASVADFLSAWRQAAAPGGAVQAPASPATPAAAAPITSTADQIQAQRRASAEAQAQALQAGYNSQWLERVDAKKREAAEAADRIQRETKERTDTLERARSVRDARIGTGSTVAVPAVAPIDPAKRAVLTRLLRTVEAVTEKRASTIGMRPLIVPAPVSRPAGPPAKSSPSAAPSRTAPVLTRAASTIPAAVAPRIARQASAAAAPAASRVRPILAGLTVFLFVVFCVFPLSCIIWASTLPDLTPTSEPTSTRSASSTLAAPTRVPTSAARAATPSPRASAAATKLPLEAVLVYTDTFQTGACRLREGASNRGTQSCNDGRLNLLPVPGLPLWTVYEGMRGNIAFEADARIITSTPSLAYGLIWAASTDRFAGFSLSSDGALSMFDYQAGAFNYSIQGLSFSAVNPGVNGNRLRVQVSDGRYAFAINGREVPFTMSASQSGGSLGFFVQSREPGAGAAFSNVHVFDLRAAGTTAVPQPTSAPTR